MSKHTAAHLTKTPGPMCAAEIAVAHVDNAKLAAKRRKTHKPGKAVAAKAATFNEYMGGKPKRNGVTDLMDNMMSTKMGRKK